MFSSFAGDIVFFCQSKSKNKIVAKKHRKPKGPGVVVRVERSSVQVKYGASVIKVEIEDIIKVKVTPIIATLRASRLQS